VKSSLTAASTFIYNIKLIVFLTNQKDYEP
jgi:hypothetical protein